MNSAISPVAGGSLVFGLLFLIACPASAPAENSEIERERSFRAGAAMVDITPRVWPLPLIGSFSYRLAKSANDPLHSRCVLLDDGKIQLAIVVVDSCYIPREVLDEAKSMASKTTGIPGDHFLVSATHTHSAPSSRVMHGTQEEKIYRAQLIEGIARSIELASERLESAEIGWAVDEVTDEVFNRRWYLKPGTMPSDPFGNKTDRVKMNPGAGNPNLVKPAGPTDPQVWTLSVRTESGRPLALLANYSLHYVGRVPGIQVSADYFGEFARLMRTRLSRDRPEEGFVAILSNGTSGDVNNINFLHPRPPREPLEQIRIVASKVADAAHKAYRKIQHSTDVELAMVERELKLDWRVPTAEQLAWAKVTLAFAEDKELPRRARDYARRVQGQATHEPTVDIKLQCIRIGDLGIAAIPFEVFAETGLEIKARSPLASTFTIELANGGYGYLPTPRQHELGGYETWLTTSRVEVEASTKITAALLEMFETLEMSKKSQQTRKN